MTMPSVTKPSPAPRPTRTGRGSNSLRRRARRRAPFPAATRSLDADVTLRSSDTAPPPAHLRDHLRHTRTQAHPARHIQAHPGSERPVPAARHRITGRASGPLGRLPSPLTNLRPLQVTSPLHSGMRPCIVLAIQSKS